MAEIIDKHPDRFLLFSHKRLFFRIYFTIVRHFYFLYRHDQFMWWHQRFQFALIFIKIVLNNKLFFSSRGRLNLLKEIIIPTNTELLRTDCQWRGKRTFSLLLSSWHLNITLKYLFGLLASTFEWSVKTSKIVFLILKMKSNENVVRSWIHEIGWNVKLKIDLSIIFSVSVHLCYFVWQNEFGNVVIYGSLPYTCAYAN